MDLFYDEVELEDMEFDQQNDVYTYPCPCGDKFILSMDDILDGEEIARCPSCTLIIRVIYDPEDFEDDDGAPTAPVSIPV